MHICLEFSSEGYKLISPSTLVSCITSTASSRYSTACFQCVSGLNGDVESTRAFSSAGKVTVNHTQRRGWRTSRSTGSWTAPHISELLQRDRVQIHSANCTGGRAQSSTAPDSQWCLWGRMPCPGKVGHAGTCPRRTVLNGAPEIQCCPPPPDRLWERCKIRPGR